MIAANTELRQLPKSVVSDYQIIRSLSEEDASYKCKELAKFLKACALSDEPLSPSIAIDDVWHEFILHTVEYITYCNTEFGKTIHHYPMRKASFEEVRECYLRTINTLMRHFGEVDTYLWPVEDESSVAICHGGGCRDR